MLRNLDNNDPNDQNVYLTVNYHELVDDDGVSTLFN